MPHLIDTSGLSCPQPMLEVKKYMDSSKDTLIHVLTDQEVSRENIRRLAVQKGWKVRLEPQDAQHTLMILSKE